MLMSHVLLSLILWSVSTMLLLAFEAPLPVVLVWSVLGGSLILVASLAAAELLRWFARGRWTLRLRRPARVT